MKKILVLVYTILIISCSGNEDNVTVEVSIQAVSPELSSSADIPIEDKSTIGTNSFFIIFDPLSYL